MIDDIFIANQAHQELNKYTHAEAATEFLSTEQQESIQYAGQHRLGYVFHPFRNELALKHWTAFEHSCTAELKPKLNMVPLIVEGPKYTLNPISADPELAAISRKRYEQTLTLANFLGAKYVVFPSLYQPIYPTVHRLDYWMSQLAEFWQDMVDQHLSHTELTIVLQNVLDDTPEIIRELLDRVQSPRMRACLDIGFANIFSHIPPMDWLDTFGSQLTLVQASNNDASHDDCEAFDQGTMDMAAFLEHLVMQPNRTHVSIKVYGQQRIQRSHNMLIQALRFQHEQVGTSKSLLL